MLGLLDCFALRIAMKHKKGAQGSYVAHDVVKPPLQSVTRLSIIGDNFVESCDNS